MTDVETDLEVTSEAEKRIRQLSEKVKLTSEERDEKDRLLKEQSDKNTELTRERDFYQGFSDVVAQNPLAKDHKDDILAKVKTGYTVEDATFAVLGKAGKLGQVKAEVSSPAGGSAATSVAQGNAQKSIAEMSREEKRQQLIDSESRGDLSVS